MTGDELNRELRALALGPSEAARVLRVSRSTMWRWLNGKMTITDLRAADIRYRLALYKGAQSGYFMTQAPAGDKTMEGWGR